MTLFAYNMLTSDPSGVPWSSCENYEGVFMKFSDLPTHSWFFLNEDASYPKYKCDTHSYEGWNIRWATPINPNQEILPAVFDKVDRVYRPTIAITN